MVSVLILPKLPYLNTYKNMAIKSPDGIPKLCLRSGLSGIQSRIWKTSKSIMLLLSKLSMLLPTLARVIAADLNHSVDEDRYYCFGRVGDGILTVRFTYRHDIIRIIGAGYWRKGKAIYERENQIHR